MKTAKEWLSELGMDNKTALEETIEKAQKEAYNQALKDVIKNAEIVVISHYEDGQSRISERTKKYIKISDCDFVELDRESIKQLRR